MKKLSKVKDIWAPSSVKKSDIQEALNYATISLPWTFDRMRYGPKSQKAVNNRLIHILMGVLNQTILERDLTKRRYKCSKDWTKYRESDVFDFIINDKIYDVKTIHLYSKYNEDVGRETFTPQLLIKNKSYEGPEWKHFFPIMVTLSQLTIDKQKDTYIFGIAETYEDLRKTNPKLNDKGFWCTVPFNKAFNFFHNVSLIRIREENKKGFLIRISWKRKYQRINGSKRKIKVTLFGEWDGKVQTENIELIESKKGKSKKEFSSLSCIKIDHPAILDQNDEIIFTVKNNFKNYIPKSTNPLINLNDDNFEWIINENSFVNLMVPNDYKVYWIGHISFNEFASKFSNYPSYFIPSPKRNMEENEPGRLTSKMKASFESLDRRRKKAIDNGKKIPWSEFATFIDGQEINAGLLLVAMRGPRPIGAACYYYPPYALWESAMYVLPQDLYPMDSL